MLTHIRDIITEHNTTRKDKPLIYSPATHIKDIITEHNTTRRDKPLIYSPATNNTTLLPCKYAHGTDTQQNRTIVNTKNILFRM